MKHLFLVSALSLFVVGHAFAGAEGGGGGGGICINGKCLTLAQAGIEIKESPTNLPYIPPPVVLTELQKIAGGLPFGGSTLLKRAVAEVHTFKVVTKISARTLKKARSDYQNIIRANNLNVEGNLEIFAFSDTANTYLLPIFFNLTPYQQALTLIHESMIREGASLTRVIEFDSLLLKYLSGADRYSYDYPRFIGSLRYNFGSTEPAFSAIVSYFEILIGRPLTLADFRDRPFDKHFAPNGYENYRDTIDTPLENYGRMAMIRSASTIGTRFYEIFSQGNMTTWGAYSIHSPSGYFYWTPDFYETDDNGKCAGKENATGFEAYVLVPHSENVTIANCSKPLINGKYLGAFVTVTMNLGNVR